MRHVDDGFEGVYRHSEKGFGRWERPEDVVNDALSTSLQAITFSSEAVLHHMHFQIKGWSGKTLGMSNHQISWEMCLVPPDEK